MDKKRYKNFARTVNEILDVSPEMDKDIIKVTVICNDDMLIENFGRVYEYTDNRATFYNKKMLVEVNGSGLSLNGVGAVTVRITGKIDSIVYSVLE